MRLFCCKYTYVFKIQVLLLCVVLLLGLCSCAKNKYSDPHEGMVCVPDGRGGEMWAPLYKDIPVSNFSPSDFYSDGEYIGYSGKEYTAFRGIDVSEHQGDIDWQAVRDDGIEFAIIRAGYRGYSQGKLYEDSCFRKNIEGALAAGLKVGVYFFSQAVNTDEASEEARFLLKIIEPYKLSLPVFFDWEKVANVGETRADNVDGDTITECCLVFCSIIKDAGYDTGVYFYRSLGYYDYKLDRLSDLVFWVGAPGETPDFYYKHRIWQYAFDGTVSGIEGGTDLNIMFQEHIESTLPPAPSIIPGAIPPEVTLPNPGNPQK